MSGCFLLIIYCNTLICFFFQSLVLGSNETKPNQWKGSCSDEAGEAGSRDDHKTDLVEESNSGVSNQKRQRMTKTSDQTFLDFLLNFDLNSVFVVNTETGSMNNRDTPLNENVCNNPLSSPAVCEHTYRSRAQSNMHKESSVPVLTSCQTVVSDLCADKQSLPLEESSDSSGSQSLLIGLIHDQGLTCSPEPKKIVQLKPTSEQPQLVNSINPALKKTTAAQHCEESQQEQIPLPLTSFDSNSVASEGSKTNTDTLNSVPFTEVLAGIKGVVTEVSLAEPYCQCNDPEESIKQLQQKQEDEVTLCSFSQCPVSSADIVCNERLCGGRPLSKVLDTTLAGAVELQASTSCEKINQPPASTPISKIPKVDQINTNSSRKIPPDTNTPTVSLVSVWATDDDDVNENDDVKSSADSDCTVIEAQEQLKSIGKDREEVATQPRLNLALVVSTYEGEREDKQHDSCKTGKEHRLQPTESTTHPLNTESSVSMLTDLSQKPFCLLPTPDHNQVTESAGQDGLQKVVKSEEAIYTTKLCQCKKKRSKHKHKKHTDHADVLNAGNNFNIENLSLMKFSDL